MIDVAQKMVARINRTAAGEAKTLKIDEETAYEITLRSLHYALEHPELTGDKLADTWNTHLWESAQNGDTHAHDYMAAFITKKIRPAYVKATAQGVDPIPVICVSAQINRDLAEQIVLHLMEDDETSTPAATEMDTDQDPVAADSPLVSVASSDLPE